MSGAAEIFEKAHSAPAESLAAMIDDLRVETLAFAAAAPAVRSTEEVESALPDFREAALRPLALSLALLDGTEPRGAEAVLWMLRTLAADLGDREGGANQAMAEVGLRELAFSLLANLLARGRLDVVPDLAAVCIPTRFERQTLRLFEAPDLRHPTAFNRTVGDAYLSWRDWLSESGLVASLPWISSAEQMQTFCAEAELLAALCFARGHGERSWCAALGSDGAVRRLRQYAYEPGPAANLARLFVVTPGELTTELNRLYALLAGGDGFGFRGPLITPDE